MFGRYEQEEFEKTGVFSLQTREEGLRLTNDLSRLTLPADRNVDYERISKMSSGDVKMYVIQDEESYVALFQDFSLDLIDHIKAK